MSRINEITIISPTRMMYISRILKENFENKGIQCHLVPNEGFNIVQYNSFLLKNPNHYYFIYCLFLLTNISRLLPRRYIIYQLEQHTNGEISHHYKKIAPFLAKIYLNAYMIFDYNEQNINVIHKTLNMKVKLLPIPFSIQKNYFSTYDQTRKDFDIVFIGLINERRRKILHYLQKHFRVGIPKGNIFGKDLIHFVCRGRLLLNIHYYNNAILERPRLNEMIPIGIPIVSEKPNELDLDIMLIYKKNIHFIDIIEENNIRSSLVSEVRNCFQNRDIESMQKIEDYFIQHFEQYF